MPVINFGTVQLFIYIHFTDEKKETEDAERNKEAFIVNDVHNKGYLHLNKRRQLCTATKLNH